MSRTRPSPDQAPNVAGHRSRRLTHHGSRHGVVAQPTYVRLRSPAVAATVDWEMSTVGDPLLDLGTMLPLMTLTSVPHSGQRSRTPTNWV